MALPKPIRWIIYALMSLAVLVLLCLGVLSLVSIPIELTAYKSMAEPLVSKAIGRKVSIDGRVEVTTSLWPAFSMEGLRIANPEGFEGDFAVMKKVHFRVSVLPMLLLKAHVKEFMVDGLSIDLREKADGSATWHSGLTDGRTENEGLDEQSTPDQANGKLSLSEDSLVIESMDIENTTVRYHDASMEKPFVLAVDSWTGQALSGKPFEMAIQGSAMEFPFTASVSGVSLKRFLETLKARLNVAVDMAQTRLELDGLFDFNPGQRALGLKVRLKSDRLDSLSPLVGIKLPAISDYEAESSFRLTENLLEMRDFQIRVGSSRLNGFMTIDNSGPLPVADLRLSSPCTDVQDFLPPDFDQDRNATLTEVEKAEPGKSGPKPGESAHGKDLERLLGPKVLDAFQAMVDIKVESVTSGKDKLGSGHLVARVEDGVFSLDPVTVNIPGGSLFLALTARKGAASLRVVVEDFDFGVIGRMYKPDTDMGGTLSLDVDLESRTKSLDGLMANASGYLDFILLPRNLHAGIVDLWAVNLITSIISRNSGDKGSTVNCAVARLTMDDGYLTPDVFAIDTTAMRICGQGRVDFKRRLIDLNVRPSAKRAEYFSLATPLAIHGGFEDFEFGIARGGIYGTILGFITSPVTASVRRLGGDYAMPPDGSDLCSMPIGAENRSIDTPKGCLPASGNTRHR